MFPALQRVFEAAECHTQSQLAAFLGIRQSSISDAKKRQSIPAEWLVKLLQQRSINPDWVLTGQGSRYLRPADDDAAMVIRVMEIRPPEHCTAQELITELVRRSFEAM